MIRSHTERSLGIRLPQQASEINQRAEECECEIDYTCPSCKAAGRFGGYTYIETRYSDLDPD